MGVSTADQKRFYSKVEQTSGCHNWMAGLDTYGYGQFWLAGRNRVAPHVAWEIAERSRTPATMLLHTCDNRRCVRLDHLYEGDAQQNAMDCNQRNRRPRGDHSPRSKLTSEQVIEIKALLGRVSQENLGRRFSISQTAISSIRTGRTWAHVS